MIGLIIGPLLYAFWLSLHQVNFMFPGRRFMGISQYLKMLQDSAFLMALMRTLYFTVVSICFQVVLGLGAAEFLNREFRGRRLILVLIILGSTHDRERNPVALDIGRQYRSPESSADAARTDQ